MQLAERAEKEYRSWYEDPKQVEHLVLMLQERDLHPKTGILRWKYGSGHAFRAMFPTERTPWATRYTKAPKPSSLKSFKVTLKKLESGQLQFGPHVPALLIQQYVQIMHSRAGSQPMDRELSLWDNPRKLLAAGLVEYCGLTARDVCEIFHQSLGIKIDDVNLRQNINSWKKSRKFPYEQSGRLTQNSPLTVSFVEYLRLLTKLTLQDIRSMIVQRYGAASFREELIDQFIQSLNAYKTKQRPQDNTGNSK